MVLKTRKLGRHWWITGDENDGPYGPYGTRAAAEEDRRGINQFVRHQDEPGFMTAESLRSDNQPQP